MRSRPKPRASSPPPRAASANANAFGLRARNGLLVDRFLLAMMLKAGKDITNKIDPPDHARAAA